MISEAILYQMRSNRTLDRNLKNFTHVQILNEQIYFHTLYAALQMCDDCGLKKQTKFIFKRLFDTYILSFPQATAQQLQFAAINFIRLSAKYNQDKCCSQKITIDQCIKKTGGVYSREAFLLFELEYYNREGFEMDFTTPYDFMGTFSKLFMMGSSTLEKITFILDFSFTLPQLMFNSSQEIFFGTMLFSYMDAGAQKYWIQRSTFYYQEALQVSLIIKAKYQQEIQEP